MAGCQMPIGTAATLLRAANDKLRSEDSDPNPAFAGPKTKLTIGSLDDPNLTITAQYNPRELQIDRSVPWEFHNVRDNRPVDARSDNEHDAEYKGGPGRSLSLELLFDGYETGTSVEPLVEALDRLACVRDIGSV
jgi:hypothetical protein